MSSKLPSCNVGPDEESEITDDDESDISKDGNRISCDESTIFFSILAYAPHISQNHPPSKICLQKYLKKVIKCLVKRLSLNVYTTFSTLKMIK